MNQQRWRNHRARGLSLVEMLVSLAITALLLTATMVAVDASFRAYAAAAETASKQTATRLTTHRLITLVRTSTAHGPTTLAESRDPNATLQNGLIRANYIELIDPDGQHLMIQYDKENEELWVHIDDDGDFEFEQAETRHPLLGGVTSCTFHLRPRIDQYGVPVLERGSIDLTVERDEDNTLSLEASSNTPIRLIASTRPRKLNR